MSRPGATTAARTSRRVASDASNAAHRIGPSVPTSPWITGCLSSSSAPAGSSHVRLPRFDLAVRAAADGQGSGYRAAFFRATFLPAAFLPRAFLVAAFLRDAFLPRVFWVAFFLRLAMTWDPPRVHLTTTAL